MSSYFSIIIAYLAKLFAGNNHYVKQTANFQK